MKVLQINSTHGIGSTGRIVSGIQSILINQNEECIAAYGRSSNQVGNNIKVGNSTSIYSHVLLTRLFDRHGFGSKKSTKQFIKEIENIKPNIIHLHNIHGYYINIKILFEYIKKTKIPVVWTLHDCWAFTGHCSHFEYSNCMKWKTGCYNCPEKNSYPKSIMVDNSKLNYIQKKEIFNGVENLTIVCPSKWLQKKVESSFLNGYPVRTISTGIDLSKFYPRESNMKEQLNIEGKFVILGVASTWTERKGISYFIKLSKRLNENEIIILIGVEQKLKNKLPKNIICIEKTESIDELAALYSIADVFINPTLEDTFPTTNLEAQACGTPVITFKTGGSPETVNQETGYVVEKYNLEDLIHAIQLIKDNKKDLYSDRCVENSKKYDMNIKFNEFIDLYKELIDFA